MARDRFSSGNQKYKCPNCGAFEYEIDTDVSNPIGSALIVAFFIAAITAVFGLLVIGLPLALLFIVLGVIRHFQNKNRTEYPYKCNQCNYSAVESVELKK